MQCHCRHICKASCSKMPGKLALVAMFAGQPASRSPATVTFAALCRLHTVCRRCTQQSINTSTVDQREALAWPEQLQSTHLCIQHAVKLQVHGGLALAQAALATVGHPRGGQGLAVLPAGVSRPAEMAAPPGCRGDEDWLSCLQACQGAMHGKLRC